ncbi:cupin domain-containing protein [Rhodocytophaga rosea]|uniref:Cupin domain-containing protein n=1 Tax=Rhodocytophaga rosea TaxID=2704465 RepID=A0A6C0GIP4_9BACT|nr:cupin domain-containing protein [Rhodocytophaga rosea]QHT67916.1 cupin domain-containing protein [Rhodocytophaga rosea]
MKRRKFLQASLIAAPLAANVPISVPDERKNKAFKVSAGEGRYHGHIQIKGLNRNSLDLKVSGKDTAGDLAIYQSTLMSPKSGPPLHIHFYQDEIFYVLEGEYLFQVGEEKYELKPGDTIFLPRNVPHTWVQLHDTGKMLVVLQPAGKMEEFFLKVASLDHEATPGEMAKIIEAHDQKVVGPPLKVD